MTEAMREYLNALGFEAVNVLRAKACRRCRVALGHPADGPFSSDQKCHSQADPAEIGCDHFAWVVIEAMESER